MESKDFFALQDAYKVMYTEAKDESPEKEEEDRKKDDDLAGSPNKKKNGKKADKDYDGDGKVESSKDEYFGSKDKAIKKAMGKDVKEARWWDVDINEAMVVTNADKKANTPAYQNYKKGLKKKDGTPMYKAADHMKEGYGKKKKKHDCASKVKHEEYGVGNCIKEMHDLDENGNVAHYDVMFDHGVEKHVPVESLQILEGHMHEHFINEKESYDTVAAVIDYDRSKKGTDDATYDSMHGKKKQAKKERDYAAFERGKMKKDDPNWKHKKGSTSEEVESLKRLIESGKFSNQEIESMAWDIYEGEGHGVSLRGLHNDRARLKNSEIGSSREKELKKRIKDKETQMQQVQSQRWNPKTKKLEKNLGSRPHVSPEAQRNENYQAMRNPEKEEKKDTRSAREKRMADPKKGINSPAFKEFMRQQGM